ncbi:unnamed protein product [Pylaiella littoralis]
MQVGWFLWTVATVLVLEHAEIEAFATGYSTKLLVAGGRHRHDRVEVPYRSSSTTLPRQPAAGAAATTGYTRRGARFFLSKTAGAMDGEDFEETVQRLARTLEEDLPLQYEKPQDLSIFDDGVEFQDPVTSLRGKLLYRGMLFFTLLFFRVACRPGSSYFTVTAIDRPARRTIRTVWETGAATAWNGRELFISGVDTFTVGDDGRISRHDSAWDQTWEQVRQQVA